MKSDIQWHEMADNREVTNVLSELYRRYWDDERWYRNPYVLAHYGDFKHPINWEITEQLWGEDYKVTIIK